MVVSIGNAVIGGDVTVERTDKESSFDVVNVGHNSHEPDWEVYTVRDEYEEVWVKHWADQGLPAINLMRVCRKCWRKR